MSVEISIDKAKCNFSMYDPKGCKECLLLCPMCVFASRPDRKRDFTIPLEQRVDPTIWELLTTWSDFCTGCAACVRSCPKGAINIQIEGQAIA